MIQTFLFETPFGNTILALFERITGCAIVLLENVEGETYATRD